MSNSPVETVQRMWSDRLSQMGGKWWASWAMIGCQEIISPKTEMVSSFEYETHESWPRTPGCGRFEVD